MSAQRVVEALDEAFARGDYRRVRRLCAKFSQKPDPEVARAVGEYRRRVGIDPVQVAVLVACLALWLWITYFYVLR